MKFGVLALLAIILSGCGILNGHRSATVEEAYYTPIILSDRSARSGQTVHISDRARSSNADYVPVITR
ncbi:hypothetical protein [Marinomonas ostreistagni]|uniref:hypothetical protein n=1 Tax=Marinomonas ostreistagni TaxID=359209 RepID=UPI00194DC42F|nr:hypothetical protein [Marinomonas ostreistagni]MBM6551657.1 hypothetical protein [Marinomonas ostreistagni]